MKVQGVVGRGKRGVAKRSVSIGGHATSVSVEEAFWQRLNEIAEERRVPISQLIEHIDATRTHSNLSSEIRLFVLASFSRSRARGGS